MRFKCFLLLSSLALLCGSTAGGAGDKSRGATDLSERWKELAGGADVWRRADVNDPHRQFIFDLVAYRVQSSNGEVTREQFLGMTRQAAPAKESAKEPPKERPAPKVEADAETAFRKLDANGDGLLDYQEMDETLQAERQKWDTNQDGFIDLDEFKEYYKARMHQERVAARAERLNQMPAHFGHRAAIVNEPPSNPNTVDLPPNLPPWFREYDTDRDGQIGLYEWKAAGQPIERFLELDHNGDGFLTPDEVLDGVRPKE